MPNPNYPESLLQSIKQKSLDKPKTSSIMNRQERNPIKGKQMNYDLVDNRGDDFGYAVLTAADLVMAFGSFFDGSWRLKHHPQIPENNPVFTLVSCYDENDNLISKKAVDNHYLDSELEALDAVKVVLSNEFDPDEHEYLLGGLDD